MLKVGKQNLLNNYLRKFYHVLNATALWNIKLLNLGYLFLLGYLLCVETNNWLGSFCVAEPQISELLFISNNTNKNPCPNRWDGEIIKKFKQKCKELFKLNKSHNKIILDLAKLINQTLVTASGRNSYRLKRFMKNFIHKRS